MSASGNDPLVEARRLAGDHGLFIVQDSEADGRDETGRPRYREVWIVYRKLAHLGSRNSYLGRRSDPAAVLRFVKRLVAPVKT